MHKRIFSWNLSLIYRDYRDISILYDSKQDIEISLENLLLVYRDYNIDSYPTGF